MLNAVPLLDLREQYRSIQSDLEECVLRVCRSQQFILGHEVQAFESELAHYCNAPYAVGVSSGTDALLIALMALGVGPGDEVITVPFTFFATAGTIARLGARPVFVDIEPDTFNIDVTLLSKRISQQTKAVMPVHLFGQMAKTEELLQLCRGIPLIEDAAQAIGAKRNGKHAGSLGEFGCFSFFPSKNLGAFGDGGLVTTSREDHYRKLLALRMHGEEKRYYHSSLGGNFRLDALQAAILRVKLKHLDDWAAKRRENAARYRELFRAAGVVGGADAPVVLPLEEPSCVHVYNQFVVRVKQRDALIPHLNANQIGNAVYYPRPLHLQECFQSLGYKLGDFPVSELAASEVLALPIFAELLDTQLQRVVEVISSFYQNR